MIRNVTVFLMAFLLTGCYTEFAYINNNVSGDTPPDSIAPGDTAYGRIPETVAADPNQVCYWTRDITGQPELRCDDPDYGRDWYMYNDYPWWNRSDPYFYGSYNYDGRDQRCPAYYYYDNTCGACRYYSGYSGGEQNSWWRNSSSGGSSASPQAPHQRRSRTGTAPTTSGSAAVPLNKSTSTQSSGSSSTGSLQRRERSVMPASGEGVSIQESPIVKEFPKEQSYDQPHAVEPQRPADVTPASQTNQQTVAPAPEPAQSATTGGNNPPQQNPNSDNSSKDRHNPRSW
jgi:hypothetical protein